jgi:cell division protein FtsQ
MVAAGLAIYGLASSPVFGLDRVATSGVALTDAGLVRAALDVPRGTNLVTLDTATLTAQLETLPTVRDAAVSAALPGTLEVRLTERRPILAWAVGERRFLADLEGRLIAELAPERAAAAGRRRVIVTGTGAPTKGRPLPCSSTGEGTALEVGDRLRPSC